MEVGHPAPCNCKYLTLGKTDEWGPIQVTPHDGALPKAPIKQIMLWNFGRPHRDGRSSDAITHASSASRIGHTIKLSKVANEIRLRKRRFLVMCPFDTAMPTEQRTCNPKQGPRWPQLLKPAGRSDRVLSAW